MLSSLNRTFAHYVDTVVLYVMHRHFPNSFEQSYNDAPDFSEVLAATAVNSQKTDPYSLTAPGEHPIWIDTTLGEELCHIKVRPAIDPHAPLLLYHHGLNEQPYDRSWKRIMRRPLAVHSVCIQAPFHENWLRPIGIGMSTLQHTYQMLAASLRILELVQSQFETEGAAYTVMAGVSWGGITSMVYAGMFQQVRAVVPMFSSPDISQVMWDTAASFHRPIPLSREQMREVLDFTPVAQPNGKTQVFPLLGEYDRFFRLPYHQEKFAQRPLAIVPAGHITGLYMHNYLYNHLKYVFTELEHGDHS